MIIEITEKKQTGEKDYWIAKYRIERNEENPLPKATISDILAAIKDYRLSEDWS